MSNAGEKKTPELILNDEDRYSRMRLIGWWDQSRISNAKVLVVGAGALGNEVLKNLALLGFGHITIIDLDTVDKTNLTRSVLFRMADEGKPKSDVAANMIRELNPDCRVVAIRGNVLTDIGLGLVRDVDVVIGCLDNREARLWVNRMCWKVGTPWIDGGIQEINGVAKVFKPPNGACYECAMTDMDYQLISLRYSCPLLKQEDILQGKVPTAPTIASIIGGMQVQEALKLIHDLPSAEGTALVFNGAANKFYQTKYPVKEDCLSHEFYDDPLELPLTHESSISELFAEFEKQTGSTPVALEMDRDFLVELKCNTCGITDAVNRPRSEVSMDRALCEKCGDVMVTLSINEIEPGQFPGKTLSELGVPAYDILKVATSDDLKFVLLAEDRPSFDATSEPTG